MCFNIFMKLKLSHFRFHKNCLLQIPSDTVLNVSVSLFTATQILTAGVSAQRSFGIVFI